jgi:fucose permease
VLLIFTYLFLLPRFDSYIMGMALTILLGAGIGMTDSSCPTILDNVFVSQYRSALGAGQVFFGAGAFLPPAVTSLFIMNSIEWQYMYYTFALLALVILLMVPAISKGPAGKDRAAQPDGRVPMRTLLTRKVILAEVILLGISTFTYCALSSIIHTYTVSYVMGYGGIDEAAAVSSLTLYSVGAVTGSILFTIALRKYHGTLLLYINPALTLIVMGICIINPGIYSFMVMFFLAGLFLGVLFSVLIGVASDIFPGHTAIAASLVAFVGGFADILSPIVTGVIETGYGIVTAFNLTLLLVFAMLAAGVILRAVYIKRNRRLA